jgi:hypothetical protein
MSNALWLWWWNSLNYNQTAEPNTNEQPALNEAVPKVFLLLPFRSIATGCRSVQSLATSLWRIQTLYLHFSCNEGKTRNLYQSLDLTRLTVPLNWVSLMLRLTLPFPQISRFWTTRHYCGTIGDSQLPYLQSNH